MGRWEKLHKIRKLQHSQFKKIWEGYKNFPSVFFFDLDTKNVIFQNQFTSLPKLYKELERTFLEKMEQFLEQFTDQDGS